MRLNVFKSKIHRATVTQADLDYEGSVTITSGTSRAARGSRRTRSAVRGAPGSSASTARRRTS